MKSVVMITNEIIEMAECIRVFSLIGSAEMTSGDRVVIQCNWGWFGIERADEVGNDFDSDEIEIIAKYMDDPFFYELAYSVSEAADLALLLMPTTPDTLVDNDHGMIKTIAEVKKLIQRGVDWQGWALFENKV